MVLTYLHLLDPEITIEQIIQNGDLTPRKWCLFEPANK